MNEMFNLKIFEDGKQQNYEILYLFQNNDTKYIVYTDNKYNENNDLNILASKYEIINDTINLIDIETDEEFDLVDEFIAKELGE